MYMGCKFVATYLDFEANPNLVEVFEGVKIVTKEIIFKFIPSIIHVSLLNSEPPIALHRFEGDINLKIFFERCYARSKDIIVTIAESIISSIKFFKNLSIDIYLGLTPDKILLINDSSGNWRALITDAVSVPSPSSIIWQAPETIGSSTFNREKSDIWSFGLILFQLVTGHVNPFAGTRYREIKAISDYLISGNVDAYTELCSGLSSNLPLWCSDIIQVCLMTDPNRRPDITSLEVALYSSKSFPDSSILSEYKPRTKTRSLTSTKSIVSESGKRYTFDSYDEKKDDKTKNYQNFIPIRKPRLTIIGENEGDTFDIDFSTKDNDQDENILIKEIEDINQTEEKNENNESTPINPNSNTIL